MGDTQIVVFILCRPLIYQVGFPDSLEADKAQFGELAATILCKAEPARETAANAYKQ